MLYDAIGRVDPTVTRLDASVSGRLHGVATRLRLYLWVEGIAWVAGFLLAAALLQFGLDYAGRGMRWSMRAALFGLICAAALWLVWRCVVAPLRLRFRPADIANLIERRYPHLSSLLVSAVRFSTGDVGSLESNSPVLAASVIARAAEEARPLDFGAVLDGRRACRSCLVLATVLAVSVFATRAWPDLTGLWFARNVLLQNVEWPKQTRLIVVLEDGGLTGARGDDLVVQAHAEGVQPREVEIVYVTESGRHGRESVVTIGSKGSYRYRYTFKNASEDFLFHLEGGDDKTATYPARLLERPRVVLSEMRITPPAYTRLDALTFRDGQRAAQVLPGSVVTIRIETNKPTTRSTLMAGTVEVAPCLRAVAPSAVAGEAVREGHSCVVTFTPRETHTYHFALVDEVGLENRRPMRFSLRVVPDEPPRARMKLPGVGDMITPEAVLPIEVDCADTLGLATVELVYRVSREDATEVLIPLPGFKPHSTTFIGTLSWPIATARLSAGESVTLLLRVADFDDVSGPNFAQSPDTTLRVVTREELLAELARREREYRVDFERLVDSQEAVRGGLLTTLGRFQQGTTLETLTAELASLERRQRNIAGSLNVIRQQFERILSELHVNQLDTLDERSRLDDGVVAPLARLVRRDLARAADTIRQWAREASTEKASLIDPQQVALLSQMRGVLANMLQWEGYQEVVNMLRDIIRLQQELHTETTETLEDRADDVFDD
jgi:hypothetical protein